MAKHRKRKKQNFLTKRFLKWLGVLTGLSAIVVFWAYFGLYGKICSELSTFLADFGFAIENVIIEGCEKVDVNIVHRHLAAVNNPCIFSLDIEGIRKDLEAFPWIRSAIVQRKLPSTLYIRVAERLPIALWQNQHDLQLIDAEGALLGTEFVEQFAHLPMVVGEGAPQIAASLVSILEQFPQLHQRFISATWIGNRRWDIFLSEKICVRLPEGNEEGALRFLDTLQKNEGILGRPLQYIDLRFPGKIIVRMKGVPNYGKIPLPTS
ncbi:MAG: FtsQ-type POTRA domain-containing protein [Holosporales bacterium]|jgi:cell division protein FtsQ|nr:FtsQ-type POTRA domain-containing protein [Holosporales bacterium]